MIGFIEGQSTSDPHTRQTKALAESLRALDTNLQDRVSKHHRQNDSNTSLTQQTVEANAHHDGECRVADSTTYNNNETVTSGSVHSGHDHAIDYADPTSFDMSLFSDDVSQWPNFLEMLDLSSPLGTSTRHPI